MATAETVAARHPLEMGWRVSHIGTLATNAWRYRELLGHLVVRNLRSQYKQSMIGYAWILVNPLLQFLVYNFVFATILTTPSQHGVPFAVFLFIGLVPWLFFSNAVLASTDSITSAASLVTVVYFPRELIVEAAVLTRLVDWLAGLAILFVMMVAYGQSLHVEMVWLLPLFFIYLVFTLGVSLPLAALNLYFRDVRYLVGIALMLLFFLTPIVYPIESVPESYRWAYNLNLNSRIVNSFRYALVGGSPPLLSLLLGAAMALVILSVGYYVFRRMEASFADRI